MALLFCEAPSRVHFGPPVVLPVHAILTIYFRKSNTSLSFSVLSMIKKQIFQAKLNVKRSPQPCSKDLKPALDLDFLFLLMTTRLRLNCYIPPSRSFILSIGIIWAKPWTHHPPPSCIPKIVRWAEILASSVVLVFITVFYVILCLYLAWIHLMAKLQTCLFKIRCFPFQYLSICNDCSVLTISTGLTAVSWLISVNTSGIRGQNNSVEEQRQLIELNAKREQAGVLVVWIFWQMQTTITTFHVWDDLTETTNQTQDIYSYIYPIGLSN